MSSHYIYVLCEKCKKTERVYTGDQETELFDDFDWEGNFVPVTMCIECKENIQPARGDMQ